MLLSTINNIGMVLEIVIIKFIFTLKMMSRNTFPELQPDSVSYLDESFIRQASILSQESETSCERQ